MLPGGPSEVSSSQIPPDGFPCFRARSVVNMVNPCESYGPALTVLTQK